MSDKRSSHLRIHTASDSPLTANTSEHTGDRLFDAFAEATGWQVSWRPGSQHRHKVQADTIIGQGQGDLRKRVQLVSTQPMDGLLDESDLFSVPITSEESAWKLLECIDDLKNQLSAAERVIARQEAELAAGIGISLRGDESEILCDRLQESLLRAVDLTGSDAAAIYLLDESTTALKMRSCWGIPQAALSKPARQLRGSMADLEALLGNAVLLENIALAAEWNSPEDFAAGLCVPIGSPHMPQGTLWLWSDHVRDFSTHDIESAKAAADKILSDVERSVLGSEVIRSRGLVKQMESASLIQASRLPDSQPVHRDYEIDGWTFQAGTLGGNFHSWNVNTHEHICAAIGDTAVSGAAGALVSASLQTIVEACWNTRQGAGQVLRKANDIAWGHSDGDWRSSLGFLQIDPNLGAVQLAAAGEIQSFIIGARGFRMIASSGPSIATQPDATYKTERFGIEPGELLLLTTGDVVGGIARGGFTQDALLAMVRELAEEHTSEIVAQLARRLPTLQGDQSTSFDRSLLIIKRKSL